ncbi:MAG: Tim44/TimA family putative adaptor protein [Sphingomonadales bacterium]
MTDGYQMIEIVILAMFAGFIILRLISVLGRRPENEEPAARPGPTMRRQMNDHDAGAAADMRRAEEAAAVPFHGDPQVRAALQKIYQADHQFDLPAFMDGARAAYEMILTAFWAGDRDAFKPFVADDVYDIFDRAIDDRPEGAADLGRTLETVKSAELVDAELHGAMAELSIAFRSRVRDADGSSSEGTDIWTFSRNVTSDDPNWLLIETRSED